MKSLTTDPLERRVLTRCQEEELLPETGGILVALSGGRDSMCLLTVLEHLAPKLGLTLSAAHYNHGLRGEEAERDQAFVEGWCQSHGIPLVCGRGDVAAEATRLGQGLEETGRQMRYEFLQRVAQGLGAAVIATAHHREDQAETVLLHLVRGAGLQGLTGIPPKRGNIIRPLLWEARQEIEAYNVRWAVPHVEDGTNEDETYTRNYLRHGVIPMLEQVNPQAAGALSRTADLLRRDNDFLNRLVAEKLLPFLQKEGNGVAVPASALAELPDNLALRGVQLLVDELGGEEILSLVHRQQVVDLARGENPSGHTDLPGGLVAQRVYETLVISLRQESREKEPETILPTPGVLSWRGTELTVQAACYGGEIQHPNSFFIKAEGEVLARPRRTGDTFTPLGRRTKTLKRWMIEEKIPQGSRENVPVLEQNGTICGVPGLGVAQSAHPKPGEAAWHITAAQNASNQ
jgi:tRNA(Ile)-lysidine synthase